MRERGERSGEKKTEARPYQPWRSGTRCNDVNKRRRLKITSWGLQPDQKDSGERGEQTKWGYFTRRDVNRGAVGAQAKRGRPKPGKHHHAASC